MVQNDLGTYDFLADRTEEGGTLKWLSLVDESTRECLAFSLDRSLTAADQRLVLTRVVRRRDAATSFPGRCRDEILEREALESVGDANEKGEW